MPRQLRIQTPGLVRHVMSRGNGKMPIFLDDRDYRQFCAFLGDFMLEFNIQCWNYCLMPNHFHATLQPTLPNLSAAIRRLSGVYGLWWNRRHDRVGHVFQGRFKDQIVDRDTYLLTLTRYVVMNPVRAGLVEHPEDWPWSSYRATVGLSATAPFVSATATLRLFGEADEDVLRSRFTRFVTSQPDDPTEFDRIRSNERILGDRLFKDLVARPVMSDPCLTRV